MHFGSVRQLTRDARENAEAYFSFDNQLLIFQSSRAPYECDQIYSMAADGSGEPTLISTGKGRTTCGYFLPSNERVIWSSTHEQSVECPPTPDHSAGYVWPIYSSYEIYSSKADGSEIRRLTDNQGYDAEATVCPKDGSIVFTSTRDGDLELYRMDADGNNLRRLTHTPGYDGGAFFDARCEKIVWRASRPKGQELRDYRDLLAKGLVRPGKLELYVANADGSDARQVTYLDAASFGPYFFPSGERIIFSSNYGSASGREFDLWAVNFDGTGLEQITFTEGFDGFPMFSHDGRYLVFGSNRNQANPHETDIFIAEWIEPGEPVGRGGSIRASDRLASDIRWLADDARAGRAVGTPQMEQTADWIAGRFEQLGLHVEKQPFEIVVAVKPGAQTSLTLDGKVGVPMQGEALGAVVASASANGEVSAPIVFANYGISAKELGYDDYAGIHAKGKIVLVRRFVPEGDAFAEEATRRRYSDIHYKARVAKARGAVGLLVIDAAPGVESKGGAKSRSASATAAHASTGGSSAEGSSTDSSAAGRTTRPVAEAPLPPLRVARHGDAGLPVIFLTREAGGHLLEGRHRASMRVDLQTQKSSAHNIVAHLPARGAEGRPRAGAIVIGAHYDHLGLGGDDSLAPAQEGEVHNGADDNASGVAAMLEVARRLVGRQAELERDVWFVAFSAEESGLLGAAHFVRKPPKGVAMGELVAMLNMDMVGRMRGNQLQVLGGRSASEWNELVEPACAEHRVGCELGGSGYGPSDQTPFYAEGVPALHFFTGAHGDYHRPSDDAEHINAAGLVQIAAIVGDVALKLSTRERKLTYLHEASPLPAGDARSYGASLGTIPDYAATGAGSGVLLSDVRSGSAADLAGLRRGDRLIRLGGHAIVNIHDMIFVLRSAQPGDKTTATVVRDGAELSVPVTYGQSRRRR